MTYAEVPEQTPENDEDSMSEMDLLFYGVSALLVLIVFLAIFSLPYAYQSSRVWYSRMDLANSNLSSGMIEKYRHQQEMALGADYSSIFRQPEAETTVGLQRVGHQCLSGIDQRARVMPHLLHVAHGQATDYLMCAMSSNMERLCVAENRERLAAQLVQFNDRRQNVYAVERVRDETLNTKSARRIAGFARAIQGDNKVQNYNPKIDPQPDSRVTAMVKDLSERGYLSATDFGYFGLALPADYIPFLVPAVSAPNC